TSAARGLRRSAGERDRSAVALLATLLEHDRDHARGATGLEAQALGGQRPDRPAVRIELAHHDRADEALLQVAGLEQVDALHLLGGEERAQVEEDRVA